MSLDKWKPGWFRLPATRRELLLEGVDGGCPTHHRCLKTVIKSRITRNAEACTVECAGYVANFQ
jgi:hypothetical protein